MNLSRRTVLASAIGLSLCAAPAALGLGRIDTYCNPLPRPGIREFIDLTMPPGLEGATVAVFYRNGEPPCQDPTVCGSQFQSVSLGVVKTWDYVPSATIPVVSFFFSAQKTGQTPAVSEMLVVRVSATNPAPVNTTNPIMFVTQVPIRSDFANLVSTFATHRASPGDAPRGGDLWIRYPGGRVKNLTRAAGKGNSDLQANNSIAVRDPAVHWSGTKAVFSMVVGSPAGNSNYPYYWQLYEVRNLGLAQAPVITRVANQPANFNNVSPCYGSDNRIIFTSDRPRNGQAHLYPQTDEYEATPTNTGLWSLNPANGDLVLLQHSPSGSFKPTVDSYGRIVYTRWDHMQRDIQKDEDLSRAYLPNQEPIFRTFNYSNESATATIGGNITSTPPVSPPEFFPEATEHMAFFVRNNSGYAGDMNGYVPHLNGIEFNRFMPWTLNQDGTVEETLNHIGRHELDETVKWAFDDRGLAYHHIPNADQANRTPMSSMFQIRESPVLRGTYVGVNAPEFGTHAAGMLVSLTGRPGLDADRMVVTNLTAGASGKYRNPLGLADGKFVSVHTPVTVNESTGNPYDFRIKTLKKVGTLWQTDVKLTHGIKKSIKYYTFYNPNNQQQNLFTYSGEMWELDPVEVVARPVPPMTTAPAVPAPEMQALTAAHVSTADLVNFLRSNNLALIVSRNVTTRDRNDRQQAFNLRIAGTTTKTTAPGTTAPLTDIRFLQLFQGDQVRGMYGSPGPGGTPAIGRRVLAVPLHDPNVTHPSVPGSPVGSVLLGNDGSMAALVPARRAMSWQLTDAAGVPVVRERYWVTFQPGEIRTCTSCHGTNARDQAGNTEPTNKPQALQDLLVYLKSIGKLPPG